MIFGAAHLRFLLNRNLKQKLCNILEIRHLFIPQFHADNFRTFKKWGPEWIRRLPAPTRNKNEYENQLHPEPLVFLVKDLIALQDVPRWVTKYCCSHVAAMIQNYAEIQEKRRQRYVFAKHNGKKFDGLLVFEINFSLPEFFFPP